MKRIFLLPAIALALFMTSCSDIDDDEQETTDVPTMTGVITIDKQYGTPNPDFTAKDMLDNGFAYGDLVRVQIGDNINVVAPFVTAYTQAGIMGVSCCDYGAKGGTVDLGLANGNFSERVGGKDGDKIVISMEEKAGYLHEYNLLQGSYTNIRSDYESDEQFANFRMVTTTGMGAQKLYRGSNPLNASKNPVHYLYMDNFAREVGINTEIDLADDDAMIQEQLTSAGYEATYCPALYNAGKTIGLKMGADTFSDDFKTRLARGLRFMIANEPPYLIHCNEGKDRCGFVTLLLEALMGATAEEIENDYMVTFENYYKYPHGSETWELNKKLNVDRMLRLMMYPTLLEDITNVNWDLLMDTSPTMLYKKTIEFLQSAGITDDEIEALKEKLQ